MGLGMWGLRQGRSRRGLGLGGFQLFNTHIETHTYIQTHTYKYRLLLSHTQTQSQRYTDI